MGALPQIDATAGPGARAVPLSPARRRQLLDRAADAAPDTARSLGLGSHEALIPKNVVEDADGTVHTRYDRTYAGLPVLGGDLVVHQQGGSRTVTYAAQGELTLGTTTAEVPAATARKSALSKASAEGTRKADAHNAPAGSCG